MQIPLQVTFHGLDKSEAVEARVGELAQKLERHHPNITSCRVVIDAPHKHRHKGQLYDVRVDITVPGGEVVVTREGSQNHAYEDVYVAIRDAFHAADRKLEELLRKQRGQVKSHEQP